jgi:hypothetical protein
MKKLVKVLAVGVALLACASLSLSPAGAQFCIPDGCWDDTLSRTDCCSGVAQPGSTECVNPEDYGTTWESCYHLCGYAT